MFELRMLTSCKTVVKMDSKVQTFGSGHKGSDNSSQTFVRNSIRTEKIMRQNFDQNKFAFSRPFNPVLGRVDTDQLVPLTSLGNRLHDDENVMDDIDGLDTLSQLQHQLQGDYYDSICFFCQVMNYFSADRIQTERLKIRRAQVQSEMRTNEVMLGRDRCSRHQALVAADVPAPTKDEIDMLMNTTFKHKGKKSANFFCEFLTKNYFCH